MAFEKVLDFYAQRDRNGVTNLEKLTKDQKVIRRLESTPKDKSFEITEGTVYDGYPSGMVVIDGRLVGFGINIYNEDVYPLKYFEIYLRNCGLTGSLDVSGCRDMVFLDVYSNSICEIKSADMPSMRIFGVQNNCLEHIDTSGMPACQGIDAGKNRLRDIDVTRNPELVELYINDNDIASVDLSHNPKLKYFYCHNDHIEKLDTRKNPLLRHLNATGNPLKEIRCIAPQNGERLPLELYAGESGCVGLRFNPVYNAQWKETGEWEQRYFAYPDDGYIFTGWTDPDGSLISQDASMKDVYGTGRILYAGFAKT